jgi:long-subunit fatty acid transport protein
MFVMGHCLPALSRNAFAVLFSLVLLAGLVTVAPVQAEMISTQEMEASNNAEAEMKDNIETINNALEKKAIQNRLDRLSPEQAQQLAERIDGVETGGNLATNNSTLLGVLVVVIIVVILI